MAEASAQGSAKALVACVPDDSDGGRIAPPGFEQVPSSVDTAIVHKKDLDCVPPSQLSHDWPKTADQQVDVGLLVIARNDD